MTQGYLVSPIIFNIVVDVVAREVLMELCGPYEAHNGFGWVAGEHNIVFYAEYGQIAGHNPIWVQTTLTEMVWMFNRMGLLTNIGKTKATVYILGLIWG